MATVRNPAFLLCLDPWHCTGIDDLRLTLALPEFLIKNIWLAYGACSRIFSDDICVCFEIGAQKFRDFPKTEFFVLSVRVYRFGEHELEDGFHDAMVQIASTDGRFVEEDYTGYERADSIDWWEREFKKGMLLL